MRVYDASGFQCESLINKFIRPSIKNKCCTQIQILMVNMAGLLDTEIRVNRIYKAYTIYCFLKYI